MLLSEALDQFEEIQKSNMKLWQQILPFIDKLEVTQDLSTKTIVLYPNYVEYVTDIRQEYLLNYCENLRFEILSYNILINTFANLINDVANMRNAQKEYFKNRTQDSLNRCKSMERQLDAKIDHLLKLKIVKSFDVKP